jgi:hypothetical protein
MLLCKGAIAKDHIAKLVKGDICANLDHFTDDDIAQAHRVVDAGKFRTVKA